MGATRAGTNPAAATAIPTPPRNPPDTLSSTQPKLKDVLILAVREDSKNSACFLREVIRNGNSALLDPEHVNFDVWRAMMIKDGMISTIAAEADNITVSRNMGERRIAVSNDRQFRVGVTYMSTHQNLIEFNIGGGQIGEFISRYISYGAANLYHVAPNHAARG
ncbi:MAG: hypothetical protein Q9226_007764, partial [Calogaya cf. arnoldii]